MPVEPPVRIHATTIAVDGSAAIIRGPSGSGKSDLALRCLMTAPNGLVHAPVDFVSDDYTELFLRDEALYARPPKEIENLLEVRGVGIVELEAVEHAQVALVVDLAQSSTIERMPAELNRVELIGHEFPALRLDAFEASAPSKLLLALKYVNQHGRLPADAAS